MSTVTLRFAPAAEHVRTARLIAVAAARRAGLDEPRLDDVRLAVAEVCVRAVRRCRDSQVLETVLLEIDDSGPCLQVTVTDQAGTRAEVEPAGAGPAGAGAAGAGAEGAGAEEEVGWALVRGLTDAAAVLPGPGGPGGIVTLSWVR